MTLLSIIIPVLNDAVALDGLLTQLQALRGASVEVIVVDGGSRDNAELVSHGRVDAWIVSRPGRAVQMNAGAQMASGKALWFVHADSNLPTSAVEQVLLAVQKFEWGRFDVRIIGNSLWLPLIACLMNIRSRWSGIATGDQGLFFRAEVFQALGGFADLPLMEDIDMSRRARGRSWPATLRARIGTSGRRWDTKGAWRTMALMSWLRWRFWRGADARTLHDIYYRRPPK